MNLALKATWTEPVAPEGGKTMSEVRVKEGKKREHYVSPSLKRKQKSEAARKNRKKFY